ncbi:unnamed protein product [Ilex paraguariensis]|uniref:Dirigent protein n=1 Tax=Ilex paraguariensis TaxID=185542 RepID=A0ABC8U4U3_9AQUA
MASFLSYTLISFYFILFLALAGNSNGSYSEELSEGIVMKQTEKTTHLHFYFHDILSGNDPSVIRIAGTPDYSSFGDTYVIDDALTEGPDPTSKLIGRAQGMYAVATQHEMALLMVINYAFIEGEYNGSSISILGRNLVMNDERDMPIVGGSGLFRFARGYALAHTAWFDVKTGDATVEYNVEGALGGNGAAAEMVDLTFALPPGATTESCN